MKFVSCSIALLLFVANINAVPLSWDQADSSSCAPQDCDQIGYGNAFIEIPVGKTLVYSARAVTQLQDRQVVLESQVELSAHSQCELNLRLNDVRVQGLADSFELKQALEASPTQFGYQSGRVSSVCSQQDESEWVQNIKRALISSLQMNANSLSAPSVVTEDDLSGSCSTRYTPLIGGYFSSSSSIKIQKEKELSSCHHRQHAQTSVWPRAYDSDVLARKVIPLVQNGSVTCVQTLESRVLSHVQCEEIQTSMGIQVRSNIELKLLKTLSGLSVRRLSPSTLSRSNLLFASNPRSRSRDSQSDELAIISQLRDLCSREEKEIVNEISRSFPALVQSLKSLDYDSLSRVQKSLNEFCQTQKVNDILLDAAREAGSKSSYKLLVEQILSGRVSNARASMLLLQLPFSQPQSARAVEQLLPLLEKYGRQAYLSVSAAAHNFLSSERGSYSNTEQLEEKLVQAFASKIPAKEEAETVALIKSIQNVGSKSARSKLVELSTSSRYSPAIRVAAIQALAHVADKQARAKLLHVFGSESETNEVRIQAYKALLAQKPEQEIIDGIEQTVSRTNNKQIASYVSTHSKNLIDSSDPHRKNILYRQIGENKNHRNSDWLSSRNIEYSYLHEQLNLGAVVESDIIFPQEALVPRALSFNLSLPMYGKSVNVLAVELRQEGMDSQMNRFLAESRNSRDVKETARSMIEFFSNHIASSSRSSKGQASLVVSLDGKVISVVSTQDLASSSASSFYSRSTSGSLLQEIRKHLESGERIDSAVASQFIDSTLTFPSLNGFPLELHINATIAVGLKGEAQLNQRFMKALLAPSVALDVQTGIHFRVHRERAGVTVVGHASSAPMIDIQGEVKEGRIYNAKINFPREKQQLIKMEVYSMVNEQKVNSRDVKKSKQCINSAHQALGLTLCGSFSRPSRNFYDQEKILSAPIELEINLIKSDSSMKGFEFQAEMPSRNSRELKLWRVSMNTPSSSIDRELSAELSLADNQKGRQEVRVNLKSPWKKTSFVTTLSNDEREKALNGELIVDGQRLVAVDMGVSSESRGKKLEMRPRMRLTIRGEQTVNLQGSISLSRGKKSQLQIDLHDARAQNSNKQYLKASFMKEGTAGAEFRLSSDVSASLPGLVDLRVQSTANRDAKQASLDAAIEYAFPRSRYAKKQSLKFSTKIQNLSSGQMNKLSAFGEISSTQFEAANWHVQYNLLRKPQEHLENELIISSSKHASTRVHFLQVSKISSRSGSLSAHAHIENTFLIEATPLAINYELRVIGEKSRNPTAAYSLSMVGKSRDGDKRKDARAQFSYEQVSRSPLKLEVSASAKLPGQQNELAYKDTIRETSDGQYNGQSEFSYGGKSTRVEYSYRTKSDSKTSHHEFDAQMMNDKRRKFSSLLRMSRSEITLRSSAENEGQQLYNADFGMNKRGPIRMLVETRQFKLNGDLNQYSEPQRSANFEFVTPSGFAHKSSIHCTPLSTHAWSFGLKSDTKRGAKPLLAIEAQLAREQQSKLLIAHPQGDFDFSISPRFQQGDLSIKSRDSRGLIHSTSYKVSPTFSVASKTEYQGSQILDLSGDHARAATNLKVDSPLINFIGARNQQSAQWEFKTKQSGNKIQHSAKLVLQPQLSFESENWLNNKKFANLKYAREQQQQQHQHDLQVETPQWSSRVRANKDSAKFELNHKRDAYEHVSEFSRDSNHAIKFSSRTDSKNVRLSDIEGRLARQHVAMPSSLKVSTKKFTSSVFFDPKNQDSKQAKFVYTQNSQDSPVDHVTQIEFKPRAQQYQIVSRTQLANNRHYNLDSLISARAPSHIRVQSPLFESQLAATLPQRQYAFDFSSNRANLKHNTKLDLTRGNFLSNTQRFNGENVVAFDSDWSNQDQIRAETKFGAKSSAQLKFNSKSLNFEAKHGDLSHASTIETSPNSWQLKSRTDRAQQSLLKVDSFLSRNSRAQDRSHFAVSSQRFGQMNAEYEPQSSRARMELKSHPYDHQTSIDFAPSSRQIKIDSKTLRHGSNILDLQSEMSRDFYSKPSSLSVRSPLFESKVDFEPQRSAAKFVLNTDSYDHSSSFEAPRSQNSRVIVLSSKTDYQRQPYIHVSLKSDQDQGQHWIEAQRGNDYYGRASADSRLNELKVEARRYSRHVLASVAPKQNGGFKVDASWDLKRDPNARASLEIDTQKVAQSGSWSSSDLKQVHVRGSYKSASLDLQTTMGRDIARGPHSVLAKINDLKGDEYEFRANHHVKGAELDCRASLNKNQREEIFSAQANLVRSKSSQATSVILALQSKNQAKMSLEATFEPKKFNVQVKSKYEKHVMAGKASGSINGQSFESQISGEIDGQKKEAQIKVDFEQKKVQMSLRVPNQAQEATLVGQFEKQAKKVSFELDSNLECKSIPSSIRFAAQVDGQKDSKSHSASMILDVEKQRVLDVEISQSEQDLQGRFNSKYSSNYELKAYGKRERSEIEYKIRVSRDARELFAAQIVGSKSGQRWSGEGFVSRDGATSMAKVKLAQEWSSNGEQNFVLSGQLADWTPAKVSWSYLNNKQGAQSKVSFCARECLTIEGVFKSRSRGLTVYEISVTKVGASARVTFSDDQSSRSKHTQRAEVVVNGQKVGYEFAKESNDFSAKVTLPSRVATAHASWTPESVKIELNPTGEQDKIVNIQLNQVTKRRGDAMTFDSSISISSGAWRRSKSASIQVTKNALNSIVIQSMIDVSRDERDALHFDIQSAIKQNNNQTASISIYSRSRADLDFTLSGHVSPKGSAGLKWQNLNRSNKVQTGFYLIQWNEKAQTIEFYRQDPVEKSLYLRAQLARESNEVDITIKRDGQEEKTLHAQAKAGCASISLADSMQTPFYRIHSCLDVSKERVLHLTADSIIEGEPVSDASLALDVRGPKTLKLHVHWEPNVIGQALYHLAESSDRYSNQYQGLSNELEHKSALVAKKLGFSFDDAMIRNSISFIADALQEMLVELAHSFKPIKSMIERMDFDAYLQGVSKRAAQVADLLIPQPVARAIQRAARSLSQKISYACDSSAACSTARDQGLARAGEELAHVIRQFGAETHQFVIVTRGKLAKLNWPSIRVQLPAWSQEYLDSVRDSVIAYFESNKELQQLIEYVLNYVRAAQREIASYDWSRASRVVSESTSLVFDPSSWKSSQRVLIYDPIKGDLVLELHSPIEHRRLQSIFQRHQSKWSKIGEQMKKVWKNARKQMKNAYKKTQSKFY